MKMKVLGIGILGVGWMMLASCCYGISENFAFVIDTIGIPRYNVIGEEINEQIYDTYGVFVYASPEAMFAKTKTQRFKSVPEKGLWTEEDGPYVSSGKRGEYYVLGTNYSGALVENVCFPVDAVPETTPEHWVFVPLVGAKPSWENSSLYQVKEQLQYMKDSQLLFDRIDTVQSRSDSYDLVEYAISPQLIGLDKMKLNTCSTWKTRGIITARRKNAKGQIREAIFATKPMAAEAQIHATLQVPTVITFPKGQTEVVVPIAYGAQVTDTNQYANEGQIKEICATLMVNGEEVDTQRDSKTVTLDKNKSIIISKDMLSNAPSPDVISIQVSCYLYTTFSVDGLLQDRIQKDITIQISEEVSPLAFDVAEEKMEIRELKLKEDELVVSPLVQTKETQNSNSIGLIQAGKHIAVKVKKEAIQENPSDSFVCKINDIILQSKVLDEKGPYIVLEIVIDKHLSNTLKSWNYLRNQVQDYWKIDFYEVGERILQPHVLTLQNASESKKCNSRIDTIDAYNLNMNYILQQTIVDKEAKAQTIVLRDWIGNV